jgi:CBS domain containing-hemolysin-like protein
MGDKISDNLPLIGVIILLIIGSAYFSATETAFTKFNRIKMKNEAANGDKRAGLVMRLADDFDNLLSTILIGNNIVNILSTSLATVLFSRLFGDAGVTVATAVMTILVLIFGEITPKSVASDASMSVSKFSAPFINILSILLTPANWIFALWKKLVGNVLKLKNADEITEEEIVSIVEEATQDGNIDEKSGGLILNAIEFDDIYVRDICTPRPYVVAVRDIATVEEIADTFEECGFSRLPVYKKTLDNILGFVNDKDFYRYMLNGEKKLEDIIHPILLAAPTMSIASLMSEFQKKRTHIAAIIDEFGGFVGLVTLEDILEELVGEIWDEHDKVVPDIRKIDDNLYTVLGTANFERVLESFDKECDESEQHISINGWLAGKLGKIPEMGDAMEYENLLIAATKVNERRAIEVTIKVEEAEE